VFTMPLDREFRARRTIASKKSRLRHGSRAPRGHQGRRTAHGHIRRHSCFPRGRAGHRLAGVRPGHGTRQMAQRRDGRSHHRCRIRRNHPYQPGRARFPISGQGKQPFNGATITVTVNSGGPKGGIIRPALRIPPDLEESLGRQGQHRRAALCRALYEDDCSTSATARASTTPSRSAPFWYGDIVPNGYALPIDDMNKSGRFPKWSYDEHAALAAQYLHLGRRRLRRPATMPDGQVLYYRRDVLNDPKKSGDFKAATGHDMVVPPKTWQQVLEIAQFFQRPETGRQRRPRSGFGRRAPSQGRRAGPLSLPVAVGLLCHHAGPTLDRYHNVYWFDPTDMTPLINSPGPRQGAGVPAGAAQERPVGRGRLEPGEAWDYFLRGKAVFVFSWGDVGGLVRDTSRSKIKGKCASTPLPARRTTGTWKRSSGSTPTTPSRSATRRAAPGRA